MLKIAILGSTGSIGMQTMEIASRFPTEIEVVGLAARTDLKKLVKQAAECGASELVLADSEGEYDSRVKRGKQALLELATASDVDLVVIAIVGSGGLMPTLAALDAGKRVALANKEALVMAGPIVKDKLKHGGHLVPIDSEHSAIWQCLQGEELAGVDRMTLTASGGAFRDLTIHEVNTVTPEQALVHPTWKMGPKVTVDSATLMNKGLEVIEASLLFDVPMDKVEVLMHRESIVHSLVYFKDSSVKAQLGLPDMKVPIQYALSHPNRWPTDLPRLNLAEVGDLHFGPVDWERYPCLGLAIEAGKQGDTYPAALCAADEVAVDSFLSGQIGFTDIARLIAQVLDQHIPCRNPSLSDILQADADARGACEKLMHNLTL